MFLVCGEALFDFFLLHEEHAGAATYAARAGGSPFNVAIGLARLDCASGLLTGISDDLLGQHRPDGRGERLGTPHVVGQIPAEGNAVVLGQGGQALHNGHGQALHGHLACQLQIACRQGIAYATEGLLGGL